MITRLKLSTIEQGLPKYRSMLAGNDAYIPAFESIATVTVGSGGTSSITFSSIPSTYAHLQIRALIKSTATSGFTADSLFCYPLSGETTASLYSRHQVSGNGSTASAVGAAESAAVTDNTVPLATVSNTFGVAIIDILDYTNTNKTRVFRTLSGYDENGAGRVAFSSYRGGGLIAISSLTLVMNSNFAQYSHFALYGIKVAS